MGYLTEDNEVSELPGVTLPPLREPFCQPHNKKSRPATDKDVSMIMALAPEMAKLLATRIGTYNGGLALAHCQIEEKDPVAFFVLTSGYVVCNPVVINHTKILQLKEEGCLSFPFHPRKFVPRWHKGIVKFQSITKDGKLSPWIEGPLKGLYAQVFQHELSHINGKSIYDSKHQ